MLGTFLRSGILRPVLPTVFGARGAEDVNVTRVDGEAPVLGEVTGEEREEECEWEAEPEEGGAEEEIVVAVEES